MLADSHCHLDRLDLAPFAGRIENALGLANAHGVKYFLCAAVDLPGRPALRRKVSGLPNVVVSVGAHPLAAHGPPPDPVELARLAAAPRVVAIGETGLDYYHAKDHQARVAQHDWFRRQIAAAKEAGKPLIIHSREARADTLRLLEEEGAATVGGVFHCFSEDWDTAERVLALGFHISFSGIVTFRGAGQIQEVARRVPAERMLVETDSPYLAPVPHRGKSNHPAWVRFVAESVARLRNEPMDTVAAVTTANYLRLFKLDSG
jgi:TatD DNase family protein